MEKELVLSLNDMLEVDISGNNMGDVETRVGQHINHLIVHDFEKLVRILYTVDVDEVKLRNILKQEHGDAGLLIGRLIIERQMQKINYRRSQQKNEESEW